MWAGGEIIVRIKNNRSPSSTVAVEAELTLAELPDEFRMQGDLEALGWKVYP